MSPHSDLLDGHEKVTLSLTIEALESADLSPSSVHARRSSVLPSFALSSCPNAVDDIPPCLFHGNIMFPQAAPLISDPSSLLEPLDNDKSFIHIHGILGNGKP
ncbi:hypothetical protein KC19_8G157500 [Ceratodon purpureus]|uniref:Uncharacterized protein n=1 Tax=Ceratodon purpureus TaxID=3225 RepID=A0A8T0H4G3_CERPU|nr:hypothetical protein KC19_8G157500 [Ceratodon purpureus]